MPAYDPAARRPPVVIDSGEAAPVDALIDLRVDEPPVLLDTIDESSASADGPEAIPAEGDFPGLPRTSTSLVPPAPAPDALTRRLAIVGAATAVVVLVAMLVRRRR